LQVLPLMPDIALFERFPGLRAVLPRVPLGRFPTPVERLARFGAAVGAPELWAKRDDLTHPSSGGHKLRALEFVFGEALRRGAREVLAFGVEGGQMGDAVLRFAPAAGLQSRVYLLPHRGPRCDRPGPPATRQPPGVILCRGFAELAARVADAVLRALLRREPLPCIIPPGAANAAGAIGFVAAGFELAEQVRAGCLPEPDLIYLAAGSLGTAAGLAVGLRAAGMRSTVVAVRVVPAFLSGLGRLRRLCRDTGKRLRAAGSGFPSVADAPESVELRDGFLGAGYGKPTPAGARASRLLLETEGIALEPTYTAKALAALIADAQTGRLRGRSVIFWVPCPFRATGTRIRSPGACPPAP